MTVEPLTLDPSRTPIEKLLQDAADGYALSEGGRARVTAWTQNQEARADAQRARQRAARLANVKEDKNYVADRDATIDLLVQLDAQLDKTIESRSRLKASRAESERAGNPVGDIPRAEPGSIAIRNREGEAKYALLTVRRKLTEPW
jgi:hypothetical protein